MTGVLSSASVGLWGEPNASAKEACQKEHVTLASSATGGEGAALDCGMGCVAVTV